MIGHTDHHRVDRRVAQHVAVGREGLDGSGGDRAACIGGLDVLPCDGESLGVQIAERDDTRLVRYLEDAGDLHAGGDAPAADDADLDDAAGGRLSQDASRNEGRHGERCDGKAAGLKECAACDGCHGAPFMR